MSNNIIRLPEDLVIKIATGDGVSSFQLDPKPLVLKILRKRPRAFSVHPKVEAPGFDVNL